MKKIAALFFLFVICSLQLFAQTDWIKSFYHLKVGNLWFNSIRLDFPGIKNNQVMTDSLPFFNASNIPMPLEAIQVPSFITVKIIPAILPPQKEGKVIITYDAVKKNTFGKTFDVFFLATNDTVQPDKTIILAPEIGEDFSYLTPEQLENAPKILFTANTYNFGTLKPGTIVQYSFEFRNDGKSDLLIRNVVSSCGCTATEAEKELLKPGEISTIDVMFDTAGRQGKEEKTVTVVSNDPYQPEVVLTITGIVE